MPGLVDAVLVALQTGVLAWSKFLVKAVGFLDSESSRSKAVVAAKVVVALVH